MERSSQKNRAIFWGVRRNVPVSSLDTCQFGGNTPCVEIQNPGVSVVLECGTGIRAMGDQWLKRGHSEGLILISGTQWEKLQGFPFFAPAYRPGTRLKVLGPCGENGGIQGPLGRQMNKPWFPVGLDAFQAELEYGEWSDVAPYADSRCRVQTLGTDGSGQGLGWRIETIGGAFIYMAPSSGVEPSRQEKMVGIAEGLVMLYLLPAHGNESFSARQEVWEEAFRVAEVSGAKSLILTGYQPQDLDVELLQLQKEFEGCTPNVIAAYEGLDVEL